MKSDVKLALQDINQHLAEENIAIFAGGGMSVDVGFVNWIDLLRPIAEELGLDVDREYDLVALAQYHCNHNENNRQRLNQRLIEEFSGKTGTTENHKILSRLPISTYWTTNYDKLIEQSLVDAGKIVDVKFSNEQLAFNDPRRDAVVYKMHGDIDHANEAVLTKDDYERYHIKMDQYLSALKRDLISKTFIFIGFGFTDPNLDFILSRVRVAYAKNNHRHYCFMKREERREGESDPDFQYRLRKQEFFINDLGRFNIHTIVITDYSEITDFLRAVEQAYKSNIIYVSGHAHTYDSWGEKNHHQLISSLTSSCVNKGFKLIPSFGHGIASEIIASSLQYIYVDKGNALRDQLIMRPFPKTSPEHASTQDLWRAYREDLLSRAGIALFMYGNKLENEDLKFATEMHDEYMMAKQKGVITIPVGVTGHMAKKLWEKEVDNLKNQEAPNELVNLFLELGDDSKSPSELVAAIFNIISWYEKTSGNETSDIELVASRSE